jgi:two-component system, OmpR family, sensor histidine kinase BaeS
MKIARFWIRLATTFAAITATALYAAANHSEPVELAAVTLTAVLAVLAASILHARRVVGLVDQVGAFADRVAAGEYSARVTAVGDDELADLAESVNAMAARLACEGHARASFIGKVSHELRTPITVIKGYVYTLRRAESDPAKVDKLDVINAECERLAYLVEDILELARAQAGELRISAETFCLRDCVEEVVDRLRGIAERRDVAIEVRWNDDTSYVMGDENRVRQIFANLLTNGIKYAPPGTAVSVHGGADGPLLRVTVADSGRGIMPDAIPRIFDEFFQGPEGAEPGAGLGLAVARELTEAHGGSLQVTSAVGRGTRFTVELPAWVEAT